MNLRKLTKIIILLFLLLTSHAFAAQRPSYRFVTYDFPPYSYLYQNQAAGPGYALVMHICKTLKINCRVDMLSWRDALWETRRGKADGVFFVEGRGPQKSWLHLSDPLIDAHYGIFTKRGLRLHFKGAKDLRVLDWKIASVKDTNAWYYFSQLLDKTSKYVKGVDGPDFLSALNALSEGKVNAVYMNQNTGYWLSKKHNIRDIRYAGSDRTVPLYFGFSKRAQEPTFVAKFNSALAQTKDIGLQRKIFKLHNIDFDF